MTVAQGNVRYTVFADLQASRTKRVQEAWPALVARVMIPTVAASKAVLPLISGATYGRKRTSRGALRNGENIEEFHLLIGDHDAGNMPPQNAVARLEALGITALVHTTASHSEAAPRWHVLAPLAKSHAPSEFPKLMARLNGALAGSLSAESFTAAQSFYTGAVQGVAYEAFESRGAFGLDEVDHLADLEVYPKKASGNGIADLEARILRGAVGDNVHDALRDLALDLLRHGASPPTAITTLQGYMGRAAWRRTHTERWQQRYDDIPRLCNVVVKAPEVTLDFTATDVEIDAADLLTTEFRPMRSIIPNIIVDGLTIVAAKPKIGKTWLVTALALAHGNGAKFLCHQIDAHESLLVALEDNDRRLKSRLKQLGTMLGTPPRGALRIRHAWPRGVEGAAQLDRYIERSPRVRLAVFDTYRGLAPTRGRGGDLVSEDYATISAYKEVADRHSLAIVIVMHLRKGADEGDWIDSISGTHGLTSAADTLLVLKRARGEDTATLSITGRDIEHDGDLGLRFDRKHGLWLLTGTAAELQASAERQEVMQALRVNGSAMTQKEIARAVERTHNRRRSTSALSQLVNSMMRDGLIVAAIGGGYELAADYRTASRGE